MAMTLKELQETNPSLEERVDIRDVKIDQSLPLPERAASLIAQIKNPYHSRYGEYKVNLIFSNKGRTLKQEEILWRVGVYIRLSREDESERDESESITNQRKILSEYIANYFIGGYEIVDFYVDDGRTGTDDSRPDFMRLREDIEKGLVNCMLCKTLSRAFRNYSDQGYYLEHFFPRYKIRFISTGDPKIDTFTNPEAITGLEVPISGLMNDRFAAQTLSAAAQNRRQGAAGASNTQGTAVSRQLREGRENIVKNGAETRAVLFTYSFRACRY
jgi:hypothetical protein